MLNEQIVNFVRSFLPADVKAEIDIWQKDTLLVSYKDRSHHQTFAPNIESRFQLGKAGYQNNLDCFKLLETKINLSSSNGNVSETLVLSEQIKNLALKAATVETILGNLRFNLKEIDNTAPTC